MTASASGIFEVKLTPKIEGAESAGHTIGRLSIEKRFDGDLEAVGTGEMLTVGTDTEGSAGYVAMEQVSGTLHGRSGTFALQHSGTMARGAPQLSVSVVPDSGTGQLRGLSGRMSIRIADGKHYYDFEYMLAEDQ